MSAKENIQMVRLRREVQQQAAQLTQTAELLQNTLKSIGDAVITTDAQGRVLQINPVAEQLTGWSESEACGRPLEEVFRIINEETREPVENPVAKVFRERTIVGLANHTLLIAKDGSERPIADSGAPIRDKQGAITGVVLVFRDQTAERAAEQALQKSEELFRSTIDDLLVGVVVHAADSSILISNSQASHILGLSKEQMLGKQVVDPAWNFVHEDLSVMKVEDYPVDRVIATGKGITNQILGIKRPDREEITWVSLSAVPVFSDKKILRRVITNFMDITESKRAELVLRESEETFRHVFELSNIGKSITTFAGELRVNQAFCDMLGYSRAELQHQSWQAISHPEDVALSQGVIDDLVSGKHDSRRFTKRYIHKNGAVVWADVSTTVHRDSNGQPLYFITAVIDITKRKLAEEALRERDEDLRESQRIAHVGSWRLNVATNEVTWSEEIYKMYGFDPSLPPPPYNEHRKMFTPESWERLSKALPETRETGIPYELELETVRPDGSNGWMWVRGEAVLDEEGVTVGLRGAAQDITDRKSAEEALRQTQAILQAAMDQSAAGIAIADAPGGELRYVNDAGLLIRGGTHESVVNGIGINKYVASWHILDLDGRPLEMDEVPLTRAVRFGETCRREFIIRRSEDDDRIVSANAAPIRDEAGKVVAGIVVFLDITEHKRAEEAHKKLQAQFAQAQKMESVGRLAGGVAHDFNNMLMGVMNYAELCRDKIEPDHPIREWLNEITVDAERSTKLTHQLLAFARKQVIAPKVIDPNDAIGGMLKLLRRLIGEDIAVNWRPGLDVWSVKMDPVQIDQVLANLAVNARDAIGGVGSISIETSNTTFDAAYCADHPGSLPGDYTLLAITDSGCGMDEETLENIFEPFFTTKGEGEGTGLGLATVYGIVKQNDGFINVYSEPDKGTTFRIYLPRLVGAEATEGAADTPTKPPCGTETVLLVEDEKSVRVTTQIFLEDLGYTVLVAEDPKKALHLVAEHPGELDLLITDVIMPGMSGRDLADRLSELRPSIKSLFMSGFTQDVIAQRGILDDGVNFLSKPFGRGALAHKVREVLGASHAPASEMTETP